MPSAINSTSKSSSPRRVAGLVKAGLPSMAKGSALGEDILIRAACGGDRLIDERDCHAKEFQLTVCRLHVKRKWLKCPHGLSGS